MASTKKLRIIIIDDDPAINMLLKTVLTKLGHHVLTFLDPTDCSCAVLKKPICFCPQEFPCADIFISDIVMSNMSGIDFFKRQRERDCKTPDVNKALISGAENEENFEVLEELGCNFFKKPFKIVEIVEWIGECSRRVPEDRTLAMPG